MPLRFQENLCAHVLVNTGDTNFHENLSGESCTVLFRQMNRHDDDDDDDDDDDNNIYLLQLGCRPVAVVILHVYKT